ncbi:MAG: SUMO ligase MMS21 Smc5/6 complex component [Sulfurimonas sp.]|jgi:SUMO ligase MMS21 Smc5/6 complex component|uniref:hypothetical protein n=1 Tax=Sulfurimonas sp. TaxID=2022749 RepID=UPI0039E408B6
MEIVTSSNTVTITGNIKSISDHQNIKNSLDALKGSNSTIIVELKDSISITSSVIGYFNKLVLKDKIRLEMKIGNPQLMELLDDLHLSKTFNALKV